MINIFFKTYGCQANVADSTNLQKYLEDLGCISVGNENDADLIIINSCAIREKAEQKMFSYLGQLLKIKQTRPYIRIGLIGCVASYKKAEAFKRFDHLNFVFGAREDLSLFKEYLVDVVESLFTIKTIYEKDPLSFSNKAGQDRDIEKKVALRSSRKFLNVFAGKKLISKDFDLELKTAKKSFVNIMTGCNNFCTYCIVPFVRGVEKSYSLDEIVKNVKTEIIAGAKEITLIGQNVNSYKDPKTGATFANLLSAVANIEGDFWIRYMSPHPKDMSEDVLAVMAEYKEKICNHIHMPVQSGSNKILELMNRPYSREYYFELIEKIRKYLPGVTISTDIIVGFPGEEEVDFSETMDLVEKVNFDLIYSFIYSKRKYTKAYSMKDSCLMSEKHRRLELLQAKGKLISYQNNLKLIGKTLKVLIENVMQNKKFAAKTQGNLLVEVVDAQDFIGKFCEVKILNAHVTSLEGEIVKK